MSNQDITIYLNTPLIQPDAKGGERVSSILIIQGKLLSEEPSGLTIQVKAVGNEKGLQDGVLPFKKVYIPSHKIDFAVFD